MPEELPNPPQPTSEAAPDAPAPAPIPFDIGEEFGTAKKNLPPAKIIVIGVVILAAIFGIVSLLSRPKTTGAGKIEQIVSVEIPDQKSVMVAVNVSFQNNGLKPFWIHNMDATLDTGASQLKDDAASAADFDRYFQAFPSLKEHALTPLKLEDKIEPGGSARGTLIFSFPVSQDDFNKAKSFQVSIWPYDQAVPLVLSR